MVTKNKEKTDLKSDLITKWRNLDVLQLQEELQNLMKEQFKLKLQHSIGELKATHKIRLIRRNIARALTLLREKTVK